MKCTTKLAISLQACWARSRAQKNKWEGDLHLTGSSSSPACAAGADLFCVFTATMSSATSWGLGRGLGLSSMASKFCHRRHCGVLAR